MTPGPDPSLILASASAIRLALLHRAGIDAVAVPAAIDEAALKRVLRADGVSAGAAAATLAEAKARAVASAHPGRVVIGADQILDLDGTWLDKPPDMAEAAAQLRRLADRAHVLATGVAVLRPGKPPWHDTDTARLVMRPLADDAIARYLADAGETVLSSVGSYQLEGPGVRLFAGIEGDFFTILGLPLLKLLGYLRETGLTPW